MKKYGLIGKTLKHSFSKGYFAEKFKKEGIKDCSYDLIEIEDISKIREIAKDYEGLNVTIPYKEVVIPFLDELSDAAKNIGAVNVIKINKDNGLFLRGDNTDYLGFMESIQKFVNVKNKKALIMGTGGASKAVAFVFRRLKVDYTFVSREREENALLYEELDEEIIKEYKIIVNCTPLGTFPDIETYPNIPYQFLTKEHYLFDLVYNPEETEFMKKGKKIGAKVKNGLEMLKLQAEYAWKIWNS